MILTLAEREELAYRREVATCLENESARCGLTADIHKLMKCSNFPADTVLSKGLAKLLQSYLTEFVEQANPHKWRGFKI